MNFKKTVRRDQELVELPILIAVIRDGFDEAEYSLCNWGTADSGGHGQDVLLDLRREPQHSHDLGHPGACDAFLTGDVGGC